MGHSNAPQNRQQLQQPASSSLTKLILAKRWEAVTSRLNTVEGQREASIKVKLDSCHGHHHALRGDALPLHVACIQSAPEHVIRLLLSAYPKGAEIPFRDGSLVIHKACEERRLSGAVVKAVLDAFPEGAKIKYNLQDRWDAYGDIAIHQALKHQAPKETIAALIDCYPEGASTPDGWGRLPIQIAASFNASVDVFRVLLEAYPQGAMVRHRDGQIPLHEIISPIMEDVRQFSCRREVILALVDAYPDGVRLHDQEGMTWSGMFGRLNRNRRQRAPGNVAA